MVICQEYNCNIRACYGDPNTKKLEYCKKHAGLDHTDLFNKKCLIEECLSMARYAKVGTKKKEYCRIHALENYLDTMRKYCIVEDCIKGASFGKEGTKIKEYCSEHKPDDYIDVVHKRCIFIGCDVQAIFSKPGSKIPQYCIAHKPDNYVVNKKICLEPNCNKTPCFGNPNMKIREYCRNHAPDNYVDVVSKRCSEKNCNKRPTYGSKDTKIKEYCVDHKPENYIDVIHELCKYKECYKRATYGVKNTKLAEYCDQHKPKDYVDVKNKKCKEENCNTQPSYGIPGYSTEYCAKHKKDKMIRNSIKYKDGFIECMICSIKVHYTEEYCKGCNFYLENGITKTRQKKELEIKNLLEDSKIEFTHDLKVKDGCSRKRPDFVIHKEWGTIILEIDEYQHNRINYSCECEITRMKQIYFDVGVKNLLFIRYNPDKYKHIKGQKNYKSKERQDYLIKYLTELKIHNNLGVVYLFYDGFINPPEVELLDPYL